MFSEGIRCQAVLDSPDMEDPVVVVAYARNFPDMYRNVALAVRLGNSGN